MVSLPINIFQKKKEKALILDLEGVFLATFELHPDVSTPSWANHMCIIEDNNDIHAVRLDAKYFLNFGLSSLRFRSGAAIL